MNKLVSPKEIVQSGLCIGCGSCVAQSNVEGTHMNFDDYGQLKPFGPGSWYNKRTEQFTQTCPFSPGAKNEDQLGALNFPTAELHHPAIGRYQSAYVGYVAEEDFRMKGSSGGLVSWVANELLKHGLIDGVAHVVATHNPQQDGRFFRYRISRTEAEIREGAKSRYYPIELSEVLSLIRDKPGRYAVVGIPCFIKAIHLVRDNDPLLKERIAFTLGLFCGHMKSARFIESFAWQMNVPVTEISRVEFRQKDPNRPANWYNAKLTLRDGQTADKDWWNLADGDWGAGFFMNNACNYCDDVVAETADISFGDAWVEPYSSDPRGTNVAVVRSPVIENLIQNAISDTRLQLETVDAMFVEQTQAAGFRQRREGLAYRLTWFKSGIKPVKRVAPDATSPTKQRKLIYRIRYLISSWGQRVFRFARFAKKPGLYINWARMAGALYYGWAYHKGSWSEIKKRFSGK